MNSADREFAAALQALPNTADAPILFFVFEPAKGERCIASRTGVRLRTRAAAEALLGTFHDVFVGGIPMRNWPPFLPPPAVVKAEGEELERCMRDLGWAR